MGGGFDFGASWIARPRVSRFSAKIFSSHEPNLELKTLMFPVSRYVIERLSVHTLN